MPWLWGDGEIIDPFGGQADLKAGLVRAVGDSWKRFAEDSLRLLRAVRFANRLGFLLDPQTEQAIRDQAGLLSAISAERIAEEFLKILHDDPEGVTWLHDLGLLQYAYPEIDLCFNCPRKPPTTSTMWADIRSRPPRPGKDEFSGLLPFYTTWANLPLRLTMPGAGRIFTTTRRSPLIWLPPYFASSSCPGRTAS